MSKHSSTRRESRNGASVERSARLPSGSLPLRKTWPISLCVGLAIGSIVVSGDALAGGPTGGTVVGGAGSISQNGNETVINQISQRLALNWETFNLKSNESVLFNQPGRSAVALNRILDQNPSQIFGKISSNGQVFLINTHGIIFGATAQMNVGGLMASTLDLTPKDFLAGNYSLNAVGAGAGIVNHGLIQAASGGSVALVGGSVVNDGVILANYGSINLDGADHAVLDFDGNGLINIQITGELKQRLDDREAAVSNTGTLKAEGGTVVLQASAAKDLFTNLVNNSGVIDASGISTDGGVVRLVGTGGNVVNSGQVAASGKHGGRIDMLSDQDVMVTGGSLDASGSQGGGAIRVGGGVRGGEGLPVAARSYVASNASLNADATGRGDGGSIAVFSRDHSVIAGSLSARGGVDGGNGGFVETSSHGALTVTGTPQVTARSIDGLGGNWLIDPNNITIVAGSGNTRINAADPFVSTNDGASLGVDLITGALTGGANVTITTGTGGANSQPGDITLNADLDYDGTGTNALTLNAAHDIILNNKIFDSALATSDSLNLSLVAGNSISLNSNIALGGGSATLTATAGSISQAAGKLLSGGDLTLEAATGIGAGNALETKVDTLTFTNSGAGGVALNDADALTVSGSTASGDVDISARTGDLTIGGDVSSTDDVTLGAGTGNVVYSSGTVSGNLVHFNAWGTNGSIGASGAVLTDAAQLSFEAKGTGAVHIVEADGASVSGTAISGDVTITSTTGNLAIGGDLSTAGDVNLTALAGSISRTAGTISGDVLTLTAGGTNGAIGAAGAVQTDAGSIAFAANGTGAVNITDGGGTDVSGTAGSGNVGITTTAGDIGVVGSGIGTAGGAVTLDAAGGGARINIGASAAVDTTNGTPAGANISLIADNADIFGTIDAGTGGSVTIRQATAGRQISLGSETAVQLSLTDAELDKITAKTIAIGNASSGNLTVFAPIGPAAANNLSLRSGGTISQVAGATITAGTLSGSSVGSTTLTEANLIGTLGSFSAAGFSLTNAQSLTVNGTVNGGASTTLKTTTGDLAINGAVNGTTTTLTSAGAITEGASGVITAGTLTGSSVGATTLNGANLIGTLGNFTAANFALSNAQALAVGGTVDGGASTTLKTTTGNLAINGAVNGTATTLSSAGAITEGTSGVITAGTLTGSSAGSTTLNRANQVGALGAFTTGGNFSFNNAQTLTVSNAPSANGGAGDLSLSTTGAGSDLILASNLAGNTVTLSAGRNISQTTGVITATTLTGSSVGSTTLNGANLIGTLGSFTASNFALTNAQALTVSGAVDGGASTTLTTTVGDLAINGAVNGTTTTLSSAGAITEGTSGVITAGTLTGSSAGSTTLNRANQVGTLGSFTAGGNFSFNDAQTLTVSNAPSANGGAGNLTLTTTGAGSDLILASNLAGNMVTLSAGRNISQTAGAITAATLTGSSVGSTTLNSANLIGALGSFSAAGFSLTNAQSLTVNGAVNGGASTTLKTTTGDLAINGAVNGTTTTLTSAGVITEGAGGVITAGTLTGSSVGATTLNGANLIGTLGNFTAVNFALSNAQALAVGGTVDGGASTTLKTTTGDLAINGAVNGTTTTLSSAGAITEGTSGVITAGTLTGSSSGSTTLNRANQVGALGAFTTGGNFSFNDAQTLTVSNAPSANGGAGNLTLTTTGAGSDLILASDLTGNTVTLGAGRNISQTTGVITATTLTGSSVGSTTLNGANLIGTLGNFSAAGFSLSNAQALTVSGAVDGGASTTLTTTVGDLAINGAVNGTTTTLTSAGAITEGASGVITAGTLTGSSAGSTTLNRANQVGTLGSFTAGGNFSFNDAQTLTVSNAPSANGGAGNLTLTTTGAGSDLILASNLAGNTVTLSAGRNISQTTGVITATTLTGSSVGSTTLNGVNLIGTLGNFSAAGFSLSNAQALTVSGAVDGGASTTLTTTVGDLAINGAVNGTTTTLSSAGAITEGTSGVITAGTLTGSSAGSTTLLQANQVDTLGAFVTGGDFAFNDAQTLTVAHAPSANGGAGDLSLTTTGAGSDLILASNLVGNTVTLRAGRNISQTAGVITAATLTGSSVGSTTLNGANLIGTLGNFSAAGFSLSNAQALTVSGAVDGGASTTLKTTTGDLAINGAVNGTTTTLTSAGAITEGAGGVITAGTLTGSSVGATTLNGANLIGTLGNFTAVNFALSNAQALAVGGTVDGGASTTLKTTTGDLAINGAVNGTTTTLSSAGAITEGTSGVITAGTLTGSSSGSTTLLQANQVDTLGAFVTGGDFAFNDAQTLTVTHAPSANGGAGDLSLTTTGAGSDLILASNLTGNTVTLSAGRNISQTTGVITATTLTGSSVGSTTLNGLNLIGTLGNFSAAGFSLSNAQTLTVSGAVDGGASTTLTTTVGDLAINGAVNGTTTTLSSAGAITEGTSGVITAGTLTGSSAGSTTLLQANQVDTLGAFVTGGDFAFNDAQTLTVTHAPSANGGAGDLSLTTTGAGSDLILASNLTGNTVTLSAGRNISQTAGAITATTLTGSSAGSTTLTGANHIGTLGSFTAANFALTNAQALTVSGPVNGGASTALKTTAGDLAINGAVNGTTTTLTSAGAITEGTSGVITAGTLTGGSVVSTTLNGANHIGTLGNFTASNFALTNAQALTVNGAVDGGASTTLKTTTGDLAINGAVNGTTTTLTSAGAITEGAGGVITAGTLTGSSSGSTSLLQANHIGTLGNFTAANFALTNAQALTVDGALDGGASTTLKTTAGDLAINGAVNGTTTTLTSAGAITEGTSGVITAGTLTGGSVVSTTLNGANHIGTLGNFTASNFALTNAQALTVNGAVNGGASTTLKTTTGDLAINGAVNGTTTTLTSAGAITEGAGGVITAGTLTGSSSGSTTLLQANQVDTLGAFVTGDDFAFNDAQTLTVTHAPSANGGAGDLSLTTTGAGSDLILASNLTGNTVTLSAGRNISQTAGAITATTLTGSSVGSTTLNGANLIGTLGNFTASNFALSNAQNLTVSGAVDGGASTTLKTTTGDLAINGAVNGTTTTLTSAGAITEGASGSLTATTLTGSSVGSTSLNGANHIGTLGNFTASNFALTNAQALTVNGAVDGGASTTLKTTTGDLAINGAVNGTTTTLTSAGAITEGASGVITAGTLTGSSSGSTTLLQANQVDTLGAFVTGGDFAFNDAQTLTVTHAPSANGGAGDLGLSTTGAGSDLILASNLTGNTVTLSAGRKISQTAGAITATTLTGSSVGSTTLTGANHIGTLGNFTASNFALTNAQALTVNGAVDGGASTTLKTTAGDLAINGGVNGTATTLTSAGAITEGAGGSLTATTLTGSSVGSTTLNGANHIGTLGNFTASNFALSNAQTLTVSGAVNGGASTMLKTTTGDLAINGSVNGTTTTLTSAGAITEGAGGVITAGTLTGSSSGSTTLLQANRVDTLGAFVTGGDFTFNDAQTLTVNNAPSANGGAGDLSLTTTGAGSDLILASNLTGNTVTLSAGRNISQTAGAITATTLTGSSVGSTTLTGANHIGTLGNFTAANFALTNAQALTVDGALDGGASTTLKTTAGDLAINGAVNGTTTTLTSAGAITEGTSGVITTGTLTGSSVGSTSLNGANHIGTLGNFTASNFALTNAQALTVNGPVDGGASTTLKTTTGDLAINGAVNGTTTTLTSAGAITEGAGGVITAGTLTGSSSGSTSLLQANHIGALGGFTAANFALTNAQALTVSGPVNGGASTALKTTAGDLAINGAVNGTMTTLTSAGTITEGAGGVITAATLSGSAVGPTVLGSAVSPNKNMVDTLGNFISLAGFSMTNDKTLTLASVAGSSFTVNAGTSPFYLSVTHGDLFQLGTAPVYDGVGVWGSTGRLGAGSSPIYVVGTGLQSIANVGMPPAYFYAVDNTGNLLPLGGGFAINVPTAAGAGSAQNGNHGDSYIDPSVITANYRSYGIVPSGVRLPPDQQSGCDPDQPDQAACQDPDALGMVMPWPKAPQ